MTLEDVLDMVDRTGHSTMPVTEDGTPTGKLLRHRHLLATTASPVIRATRRFASS